MHGYQGKKAFITGGSSGIGKAVARLLTEAGAEVVIGARRAELLDQTLDELRPRQRGRVLERVVLDVGDRASVANAAPQVLRQLGGLDLLINNAGIAHPGYVETMDDEVFDAMMRVNYFGTVYTTRAFLPQLVGQRSGHICNVSSVLGFLGIFGYTAYAASKFAVCGFSDCLRQELLPHGVGLSVVFPPDTNTPQLQEENKIKPPETRAIAGNVRMMEPAQVAQAMLTGIARGSYHIVPGWGGKLTYAAQRYAPQLVRFVIDRELKRSQRPRP